MTAESPIRRLRWAAAAPAETLTASPRPSGKRFEGVFIRAQHRFCTIRLEIFHRYGNFTMAYATLQPGMKYFESHGGYLAYDTCLAYPHSC